MEFRETLSVAVRNQKQKSSNMYCYKSRCDPQKKEQKDNDKPSANIHNLLAQKEGEEIQKQLEAQIKRKELIAMRDPKMMEKYSKLPEEPKCETITNTSIEDLNSTRERVKNALLHENVTVSHKRGRREDNEKELSPLQKYEHEKVHDKTTGKPIVKKQIPLQMDFHQLLKFAVENKSEPINIATKKQITEPDRITNKRQKIVYEEEIVQRKRRQKKMEAEKAGNRKVPKINKPRNEKKLKPSCIDCISKLSDKYHANQQYDPVKFTIKEKKRSELGREKVREKSESNRLKYERKKEIIEVERLEKHKAKNKYRQIHTDRLNRDRYTSDKKNFIIESKTDNLKKSVNSLQKPIQKIIQEVKYEKKKNVGVKSQNTYRLDKSQLGTNCSTTGITGNSTQVKGLICPGKSVYKELLEKKYSGDKFAKTNNQMHTGHQSLKNKGMDRSDSAKRSESSTEIPMIRPEDKKSKAKSFARSSKPKITNSFNFDQYVNSIEPKGVYKLPPEVHRKPNSDNLKKKIRQLFFSESDCESESDDCIYEEK